MLLTTLKLVREKSVGSDTANFLYSLRVEEVFADITVQPAGTDACQPGDPGGGHQQPR